MVLKNFYRLEKSKNSASGGVGLGLSAAENVFLAHDGILTLANRKPSGLIVKVKLNSGSTSGR